MSTSRGYLLGGVLFFVAGLLVLANAQPVWWSVASVVIVFSAAAVMTGRAVTDWRKGRSRT